MSLCLEKTLNKPFHFWLAETKDVVAYVSEEVSSKPLSFPDKDPLDIEGELRKWLSNLRHKDSHAADGDDSDDDVFDSDDEHDDDGDDTLTDGTVDEDVEKLENSGDDPERLQVGPYQHYRTQLGSPSVNRRSFTVEELNIFEGKFCL